MEATQRDLAFGRAMGRVLAHELYHILANEKGHDRTGIAKPVITAQELLAGSIRFQPKQVRTLRAKLVPVLLQSHEFSDGRDASEEAAIFISSGCSGCHGPLGEGTPWGPPLQKMETAFNSRELATLLRNRDREMYKRAKRLNVIWPSLRGADIDALATYLRNLNKNETPARQSRAPMPLGVDRSVPANPTNILERSGMAKHLQIALPAARRDMK